MADDNITDDNQDAWSSSKMSTSGNSCGSDEEEAGEVMNNPSARRPTDASNNKGKFRITLNNSRSNNLVNEPPPWIPTMSLLDLAHKLKQAEMRVFGLHSYDFSQREEPYSGDETDESGLGDKRFLSSDENSKLGHFDTPKSTTNSVNYSEKGNVRSMCINIKREHMSDSNMDDNAFDLSKSAELGSACENSNCEASQKRHHCAWCKYETDSKSHLLRHQKTVHQMVLSNEIASAVLNTKPVEKTSETEVGKSGNSRFLRRHRCELCSYQTDSKSHLRRHQGSVHSKKKPYKCHLCKMEFSRSEKAKEHFMNMHSDVPYDSRKKKKVPTATLR